MKILFLKKGFTLIEILVYIAVLAIIISTISSLFLWAIRSNTKTKAMRETMDNGRRVMEIMTYEIREAKSIYIPTTTSTQLSLETTHYLPQGEKTTYVDFYLCENRLCFKKEAQDPMILTSDKIEIKNLSFTRIETTSTQPSVQVNLEANYKNPSNLPEYQALLNLNSSASLRSY